MHMANGHIRPVAIHPCVSSACGLSDALHYHAGHHPRPLANEGLDFLHRQVELFADEQDPDTIQTGFPPEIRIEKNGMETGRRLMQRVYEPVKTLPFYLLHQVFLH